LMMRRHLHSSQVQIALQQVQNGALSHDGTREQQAVLPVSAIT
jgi:hypothetical protein